tara:strand:+ start:103 stop:573 length:471 start_codon:yes stop_codon:yes gene_type:complete
MHNAAAQKININRRTLQAVLRVNPALAGGRSTADFKDFLEKGGAMTLRNTPANTDLPNQEQSQGETNDARVQFEQALGFFVRTQTSEAAATIEELEAQKAQIEAAIEQTKKHAETKLKSFVRMLDPVSVAQFGPQALKAQSSELKAVGINLSNILA